MSQGRTVVARLVRPVNAGAKPKTIASNATKKTQTARTKQIVTGTRTLAKSPAMTQLAHRVSPTTG